MAGCRDYIVKFIESVLNGEIKNGEPLKFLVTAKQLAKTTEDKKLAQDVFNSVDELLYLRLTYESDEDKIDNKEKQTIVEEWLREQLEKIGPAG